MQNIEAAVVVAIHASQPTAAELRLDIGEFVKDSVNTAQLDAELKLLHAEEFQDLRVAIAQESSDDIELVEDQSPQGSTETECMSELEHADSHLLLVARDQAVMETAHEHECTEIMALAAAALVC